MIAQSIKKTVFLAIVSGFYVACGTPKTQSAESQLSSTVSTSETCKFLGDAYESKVLLPGGSHKGECADTTSARSVMLLPESSDSNVLRVANVGHNGSFWVAEFPKNGVEEVIFQMERFPAIVPAAHTQIRLKFKKDSPVRLTNQLDSRKQIHLLEFALSTEAIGQKGWNYDIFKGMKDEYLTAYRITSLADKYKWMVVTQKHSVVQWPLNLDEKEKQLVLPAYVKRATEKGMTSTYHTLWRNCTNELFKVFDSTLRYGGLRALPVVFTKINETYPVIVHGALNSRGLIRYRDLPPVYPPDRPLDKTTQVPTREEIRLPNFEYEKDLSLDELVP
ncbi:MAG: hypothetical protein RLZZ488_2372 [Pseudomonadota bacterium]|jgi:hypothetical protein